MLCDALEKLSYKTLQPRISYFKDNIITAIQYEGAMWGLFGCYSKFEKIKEVTAIFLVILFYLALWLRSDHFMHLSVKHDMHDQFRLALYC